MNYLGLDVHSSNFVIAHVNHHGKLCRQYARPTSASALIEVVGEIRGPKRLVVEECHLAQWVKHVLERYVDELVVCDTTRNRWIAADDYADDASSARKLAELLRGEFIKPIRHPDDAGAALRSSFLHYYSLTRQITRCKNMLKATFRQVAVRTPGAEVYQADQRQLYLSKLKEFAHLQPQARHWMDVLETLAPAKQEAFRAMVKLAKQAGAYEVLQTIPGVGPVIAAGYIALIDTPHRFSRKNKLWAYACLGNRYHESDGRVYGKGRSQTGCRPLKWLVMQQFTAAVDHTKASNRFKKQYQALKEQGLGPKTARRQVCRAMLSVTRAVWMKGQAYRDAA